MSQEWRRLGVLVYGRCGLGDNIYWRPLVRSLARETRVWVETPWPELFVDIPNVTPVVPRKTKLRTQIKNIVRHRAAGSYQDPPRNPQGRPRVVELRLKYDWRDLRMTSVIGAMERALPAPVDPFVFDLPDFGASPVMSQQRPLAVLRPATERTEWLNRARNPDPRYLVEAAEVLRDEGFHVVVVADLAPGSEWSPGPLPEGDESYLKGELQVGQLMALIQGADLVVGPVGWIVPASVAAGTPLVVIGGGQGGHNAPGKVTDPRMDTSRLRWVLPDPYCRCEDMLHDCPKEIPDFRDKLALAIADVSGSEEAAA